MHASSRLGPWRTLVLCGVGLGLVLTLLLAVLVPQAGVPVLLAVLLLVLWERLRVQRELAALTRQIVAGELARKLEVSDGAVGPLCHAVNGLLQQRRIQEREQALLPRLPAPVRRQLLDNPERATMTQHMPLATVLLVGHTRPGVRNSNETQALVAACRLLAEEAQEQAGRHDALVQLCGDSLLLIFGLFEPQSHEVQLRAALETAQALRRRWGVAGPMARGRLSLSIASGSLVADLLPGLGYSVLGAPIEQVLRLQHLAAACPEYALLCSEEAYAPLQQAPRPHEWLPTDLRLLQPGRAPQAVYALPV